MPQGSYGSPSSHLFLRDGPPHHPLAYLKMVPKCETSLVDVGIAEFAVWEGLAGTPEGQVVWLALQGVVAVLVVLHLP